MVRQCLLLRVHWNNKLQQCPLSCHFSFHFSHNGHLVFPDQLSPCHGAFVPVLLLGIVSHIFTTVLAQSYLSYRWPCLTIPRQLFFQQVLVFSSCFTFLGLNCSLHERIPLLVVMVSSLSGAGSTEAGITSVSLVPPSIFHVQSCCAFDTW